MSTETGQVHSARVLSERLPPWSDCGSSTGCGYGSSGAAAWTRKGHLISLSLKDADLKEILRSFAKLGRFNLVLDPGVQGKVTVELHDVPWDQALSVILKTHGLAAEGASGRLLFP